MKLYELIAVINTEKSCISTDTKVSLYSVDGKSYTYSYYNFETQSWKTPAPWGNEVYRPISDFYNWNVVKVTALIGNSFSIRIEE